MDDPSRNPAQDAPIKDAPIQDIAGSDDVVESKPQQMFDITSDLNINPVKPGQEESAAEAKPIPSSVIPKTALQDEIQSALGSRFKISPDTSPKPESKPQPKPQPVVTQVVNAQIPKSISETPVTQETQPTAATSPNIQTPSIQEKSNIPLQDFSAALKKAQTPNSPAPSQPAPFVPPPPTPTPPPPPVSPITATTFSEPQKIEEPSPAPRSEPVEPVNSRFSPASPPTKTLGGVPEQSQRKIPQIDKATAAPIKSIKTFEGDVAETLSHTRASTASIAIAESIKKQGEARISTAPEKTVEVEREEPKGPSNAPKNIFFILLSFVLICGGAIGGYYLYSVSPLAPSKTPPLPTQPATAAALIPIDSQASIDIEGKSSTAIVKLIEAEIMKDQKPNSIKEIVLSSTNETGRIRVPAKDMLDTMKIPAPDILKRSLNTPWMLGVYNDSSNNKSVFVIATNNFFQNSFAGMLQWERLMADDIKKYLYVPPVVSQPALTATSTASSTLSSTTAATAPSSTNAAYITIRGAFEDRIVGNKDVREFMTTDRGLLFLYSFISNDKLLITDKESTLIEILVRIEKQSFMR